MKMTRAFYLSLLLLSCSLRSSTQECPDMDNFLKGEVLLESKQYQQAEGFFAELALEGEATAAKHYLAKCLFYQHRYTKAIEYNTMALEKANECAEINYWQGHLLATVGSLLESIKYFNKAQKLGYDKTKSLQGLALAKIGIRDYKQAEKDINALLAHDNSPKNQILKAELYLNQNKEKQAIDILNPLIENHPKEAKAHFLLSICYMEEKNTTESIKHYKEASNLNIDYADPNVSEGIERYMDGNNKEACKLWKKSGKLTKPMADELINMYCK